MDFRRLIIAQKDSSTKYIFNNKVNLVTSTSLSDELLKPNYDLKETTYYFESLDNISIADVFQIKVRIASTGIVMVNFRSDTLNEEQKQALFSEISALKDNVEPSIESQKAKIGNLVDIVSKYQPIYLAFANTGDFLFVRSTFEEILLTKNIDYPFLVLLPSIGFVDTPTDSKRRKQNKQNVSSQLVQKKVKQPGEKTTFKDILLAFKSMDFVFFGIFSIFIAFGLLISIFEIQNGEGIAAFLLILTIAFVITLNYATYKAKKENPDFEYTPQGLGVPLTYIIVGIVIGIVVGWLITTYVIKVKEEVIINYVLVYGISIPVSLLVAALSLFTPTPIGKFISKIKKNK